MNNFVGTHPMSGNEISGLETASSDLFENKPWVICPSSTTDKRKIKLVKDFVASLGANPFIMDPKRHDQIAALASHIFLITSSILVNAVTKNNWDKIAQVASTGFKDTTRLASHSSNMKKEIILTNKSNIKNALMDLSNEIDRFSSLLNNDKETELKEYFQKAKSLRDDWINKYFTHV